MRCPWMTAAAAVVAVAAGPAWGQAADEAQRVAEIQAQLMAGNADAAVDAAREFVKGAKDEQAKTEAMRVLAEGLRKKGDWRGAMMAYSGLRERFDKTSDEYVRYGAIADVLKGAPDGVYQSPGVKPPAGTEPPKVSDDAALEAALAQLALARAGRLKSREPFVKRGRTPQEVMQAFGPAADEARQVFLIGPDTPPADARSLGAAAGDRLKVIAGAAQTTLRTKLQKYQPKFNNPWSFTNVEKEDIQKTHQLLKEMAAAEKAFQESLFHVTGKGEWELAATLRSESNERRTAYEQLAEEYVVPAYRTIWGW